MFPIIYVPPLQTGDLKCSIERLHKCVDSKLLYQPIHTLRRCHELTHYVMGRVENKPSLDCSTKLGHRLTLILREASETHSSDVIIQVQLFGSYAALANCIKPGDLIVLTGVRVDISEMCRPNRRIPHSQLHISAKPQYQRNFKLIFMPVNTDMVLADEVAKFRITSISNSKFMKSTAEPVYVNVLGIITACTPFEKVNEKEWNCFITLADHSVKHKYIHECGTLNSSLLIKFIASTCLNTFERGHILRISELQITQQNDVVLGLMRAGCQKELFQVSSDDTISVLPLHSETRILSSDWQKVKDLCHWWITVEQLEHKSDFLRSYLLSKGFLVARCSFSMEALLNHDESIKGLPELGISPIPNTRKRKNSQGCDCMRNTEDCVKGNTSPISPLKNADNVVPFHHPGKNDCQKIPDLTNQSHLINFNYDETRTPNTAEDLHNDVVSFHLEASGCQKNDNTEQKIIYVGKLPKLNKLDSDMSFDIDCQVVGYYYCKTFDKVVLKVWDGSRCRYGKNKDIVPALFTTKFEDKNLKDIEDYCVDVDVFGKYKEDADNIELFDIINLCNVRANSGRLHIHDRYLQQCTISIYPSGPFSKTWNCDLNMIRSKLRKAYMYMDRTLHCRPTNSQSPQIHSYQSVSPNPSTSLKNTCNDLLIGLTKTNISSVADAFELLDKIKQDLLLKERTVAITSRQMLSDVPVDAIEHSAVLYDPSSFKPQNKHLQSSLSSLCEEDLYFDIFCQVVGCYKNAEPLKVILKIWDGTKCRYAKCTNRYASWTTVFEDPNLNDIEDYCVYVNVYDQYMAMTDSLKLFDIVKLCNVRARSGVYSMHGGKINQRKILICASNAAVAKPLIHTLNAIRKNLIKNNKATDDIASFEGVIQPVQVEINATDDSNKQNSPPVSKTSSNVPLSVDSAVKVDKVKYDSLDRRAKVNKMSSKEVTIELCREVQVLKSTSPTPEKIFFPTIVCANPIKKCKELPSSVAKITRTLLPAMFCFCGAVLDVLPRADKVLDLVKWYCKSCQNTVLSKDLKDLIALGHHRYQCPCHNLLKQTSTPIMASTNKILEPIFVLYLKICDLRRQNLKVMVCGQHAETFFRNFAPVDLLNHQDVRDQFAALLQNLCTQPGRLTQSSFALHCQICSSIKAGKTTYNIVHTQLIPFEEIIK